jgi:hypothetical protein
VFKTKQFAGNCEFRACVVSGVQMERGGARDCVSSPRGSAKSGVSGVAKETNNGGGSTCDNGSGAFSSGAAANWQTFTVHSVGVLSVASVDAVHGGPDQQADRKRHKRQIDTYPFHLRNSTQMPFC